MLGRGRTTPSVTLKTLTTRPCEVTGAVGRQRFHKVGPWPDYAISNPRNYYNKALFSNGGSRARVLSNKECCLVVVVVVETFVKDACEVKKAVGTNRKVTLAR